MHDEDDEVQGNDAIMANAAALAALYQAGLGDADMGAQGDFLIRIGLSRKRAASLLGTSSNSLNVLLGRRKQKARAGSRGARK